MTHPDHIIVFNLGDLPPANPEPLFDKPIFFGSPDCTSEVERAHAQMDAAFHLAGCLQQPPHCDSEECARKCAGMDEQGWEQVREYARSIVRALGVPEILK